MSVITGLLVTLSVVLGTITSTALRKGGQLLAIKKQIGGFLHHENNTCLRHVYYKYFLFSHAVIIIRYDMEQTRGFFETLRLLCPASRPHSAQLTSWISMILAFLQKVVVRSPVGLRSLRQSLSSTSF